MKTKSTRQLLKKIPNVPCLYRHRENGAYYGIRKVQRKIVTKALVTSNGENIIDRKLAEGALRMWIDGHETAVETPSGLGMTFAQVWSDLIKLKFGAEFNPETYREAVTGKTRKERMEAKRKRIQERKSDRQHSSKLKYVWMHETMRRDFPGFQKPIRDVNLEDLEVFLTAVSLKTLKPASFNLISWTLNSVLERAVNHDLLAKNPYARLDQKIRQRKNVKEKETIPTIEQCQQIVAHIRTQDYLQAQDMADYLELAHRAALGQAEISALCWENVKWDDGLIEIKRQKTGKDFSFPIYPFLDPFLKSLWKKQGEPKTGPVMSVSDPRNVMYKTCRTLKLPPFSPRDMRKARIRYLYVEKQIPADDLGRWQGHADGKLIINTYGNGVNSGDKERQQRLMALLN
jgi:integrase